MDTAWSRLRWFIILVSALTLLPDDGLGKGAVHWSIYKTSDGLVEPAYNALSFSPQGKLIAIRFGSTNGAELDGYSVSNFSLPTTSIERVCESPGGELWGETPDGLLESRKGAWMEHSLRDISGGLDWATGALLQFLPVRQGCVLVLYANGLIEFSTANPGPPQTTVICTPAQLSIGPFSGMAVSADGGLWICGERGAAKTAIPVRNLTPAAEWQVFELPKSMHLKRLKNPEPDAEDGITFVAESGANHQKSVVTFDGRQWAARPAGSADFVWGWRGPGLTYWAATAESLFLWDDTNWVENDEISPGQIYDVNVEPGGAFWLATRGELIRGSTPLWQKPGVVGDLDAEPQCIAEDSEKDVCFIANNHLYVLANGSCRKFSIPTLPQNRTVEYALFPLRNGSMLVQAGDGLFQFQGASGSFKTFSRTEEPESALGMLPDGNVCIYKGGTNSCFVEFDGTRIRPMSDVPAINDSGAVFTTLLAAQNGDLWIGGWKTGVLWRHDDQWQSFASSESPGPESVVSFLEMANGTILCATRRELWQFDGRKSWLLLQSGFDHINGLIRSRDGSIWVAANGGLFRFYNGAWLENAAGEDLPDGAVHAVFEDARSQLWAATADGLRVFHPEADAGLPKTFIHSAAGEGAQLSEGNTLDLLLEGQAKWKFTPSRRLLYSYQMDGAGWSAFQELTTLSFASLVAGRHSFQVCAMDTAGTVQTVPATLDFTVTVPWFKEGRLWIAIVAGGVLAIFFAGIALNRHRQLVLSHAEVERKVAQRTQELEVATRELFHSQKMSALGTLAAGIAHDFNNILSIVKGSAQIIEDNLDAPEKIQTRVDRIKTVVQQGAEIVDAMLGFGRGSNALPAPCDVNTVVADTMQLLGDRFPREVEVKFERGEHLPEILAPREFIQQILLNFIFNAAEAMNGRKEITLATRMTEKLPPEIFLAPAPSASFVAVSVRDVGCGMAPEIVSRIFEPFFTTKALSTRRGAGLGLSMVYELAKKMQAGLAVQSAVASGSTFTLILPVSVNPDMNNGRASKNL